MSFARPTWHKVGIALALWSSWVLLAAASEVRTLKNIELISLESNEQVRLEFDGEFLGEPLINFESGSMSLRFSSVNTDPRLPLLPASKDNSLIRAVRAVQVPNTNFVHLDILLRPPQMQLGHPDITRSGNYLLLGLRGNNSTTPALSNTEVLTEEIEERVKTDQSFTSTFARESPDEPPSKLANDLLPMPTQDWASTMLTLVLALLFVLLLIYLIAFLYNRFFSGRFPSMQGNLKIRQVSSYHVGPKQKIIVFDMNGRIFACGVTPSSINLIAELHEETDQEFLHSIQTDEKTNEINIDHTRANYIKTLDRSRQHAETTKPKHTESKENLDTSIEFEGQEKGVFLESNSEKGNGANKSNDKNNEFKTTVRPRFPETPVKNEKLFHGNQMMQSFASKLSEHLKFLKPIK